MLPWCIKPMFGFISDSFPLLGYKRKSYLVIISTVEMAGFLYLSMYVSDILTAALIQVFLTACMVFRNVIGEALIVGITKETMSDDLSEDEKQAQAQGQISMFSGARSVGSLIFSYMGGAILEIVTHRTIFMICAIFPMIVALMALVFNEPKHTVIVRKSIRQDMIKISGVLCNPKIRDLLIIVIILVMSPSIGTVFNFF